MNKLTNEILTFLLSSKGYFEPKTGKIKINKLQMDYENFREARFYDEIYFPKLQRLTDSLRKKPKLAGKIEWYLIEDMGYMKNIPIWYPVEIEIQEWLGDFMQRLTQEIWYGEDWAWETLQEEDVRVLGIVPDETQLRLL